MQFARKAEVIAPAKGRAGKKSRAQGEGEMLEGETDADEEDYEKSNKKAPPRYATARG